MNICYSMAPVTAWFSRSQPGEGARRDTQFWPHHSPHLYRNIHLQQGSYADCAGSRLVIITAGAQIRQGQTRDELALINAKISVDIARELEQVVPDAILLFATNPVDLVCRFVIENTHYPAQRVLSSGCVLDSARFMKIVSDKVGWILKT